MASSGELRFAAIAGLADCLICGALVSWKRTIPELVAPRAIGGVDGILESVYAAPCPHCHREGLEPISGSFFPVFEVRVT